MDTQKLSAFKVLGLLLLVSILALLVVLMRSEQHQICSHIEMTEIYQFNLI